jgi:hypothetical protein
VEAWLDEVRALRLRPGVPVLDVWHTGIDQDGEPYELTRFVMRGDMTGGARRANIAVRIRPARLIRHARYRVRCGPSSSAYQCPGRGHRVKSAFGVARDRFATLDPATAPQGFGAYRGRRGETRIGHSR